MNPNKDFRTSAKMKTSRGNPLVRAGLRLGVNLDKPKRIRKVGNSF